MGLAAGSEYLLYCICVCQKNIWSYLILIQTIPRHFPRIMIFEYSFLGSCLKRQKSLILSMSRETNIPGTCFGNSFRGGLGNKFDMEYLSF